MGFPVIIIKYNLDVIKTADWISGLGPESSAEGGYSIPKNTSEDIAQIKANSTGWFSKSIIHEYNLVH